jgi:hypothetical protein
MQQLKTDFNSDTILRSKVIQVANSLSEMNNGNSFGGLATEPTLLQVAAYLGFLTAAADATSLRTQASFFIDGNLQTVTEDTVNPANNSPLPVKLTGVTGDINITAGDLNIHSSHTGANPDSMQIGDGTEIMLVNADGSINTKNSGVDLNQYKAQDEAVDSGDPNIEYYGFANTAGAWFILEANATAKTYRYLNGTTGYIAAWGTRETNVYDYIFNLTW